MQKNSLSERRLIVSGHLMEDEARDHQFNNSLPISNEDINGKKVISLFSVRGRREEKLEAFDFIYKFAELHKDIILLIRSHPSENAVDTIPPPEELNNVYIIDYTDENSKITLYDQLTVSHLSICFGSTVALESKWFGVPCITFEKRDKSLIYLTDNEIIFHVKTKDEFIQKINDLLSIGKKDKFKLMKVADCILETLLQ
jgi:predicted glycosyltransferase